jgi:hypothetical protein
MENEEQDGLKLAMERELKAELIDYLADHATHSDRYDSGRLAWNIKTYRADHDLDNKELRKEYGLKERWDTKWGETIESDDGLIWQCCEDGLGFVGDEKYRHWNWNEGMEEIGDCTYELYQTGRSGGWLELHKFDGSEVKAEDFIIPEEYHCNSCSADEGCNEELHHDIALNEYLDELDYDWLKKLVIFCKSLDKFDADKELEHQLAFRRQQMEEEWEKEDFNETEYEEGLHL